jgi:nucleoid-associated protein YgaU
MIHNQTEKAHRAAEEAAKNFGYLSYADLNESVDEQAKEAARAAFDEALAGCQQEV